MTIEDEGKLTTEASDRVITRGLRKIGAVMSETSRAAWPAMTAGEYDFVLGNVPGAERQERMAQLLSWKVKDAFGRRQQKDALAIEFCDEQGNRDVLVVDATDETKIVSDTFENRILQVRLAQYEVDGSRTPFAYIAIPLDGKNIKARQRAVVTLAAIRSENVITPPWVISSPRKQSPFVIYGTVEAAQTKEFLRVAAASGFDQTAFQRAHQALITAARELYDKGGYVFGHNASHYLRFSPTGAVVLQHPDGLVPLNPKDDVEKKKFREFWFGDERMADVYARNNLAYFLIYLKTGIPAEGSAEYAHTGRFFTADAISRYPVFGEYKPYEGEDYRSWLDRMSQLPV